MVCTFPRFFQIVIVFIVKLQNIHALHCYGVESDSLGKWQTTSKRLHLTSCMAMLASPQRQLCVKGLEVLDGFISFLCPLRVAPKWETKVTYRMVI